MIDYWAIDDANLTPYQFRLMHHIARVGICFKSVRTLADNCNMSVGKVSETRTWLEENGFIEMTVHPQSGKIGYQITSKYQRSPDEQVQQYCSPGEQNVHDMNKTGSERSSHEQGCSPHEPKELNIRQDILSQTVTAISSICRETYWAKTQRDFEDAAYELIGRDATPDEIVSFGEWWKVSGWHKQKPVLKNILDSWHDFKNGVTVEPTTIPANGATAEAWKTAVDHASRGDANFTDDRIKTAVRIIGWPKLQMMIPGSYTESELKKRFLEAYNAAA